MSWDKKHKPIFIVFIDLLMAISFFCATSIYYTKIMGDVYTDFHKPVEIFFDEFIPRGIVFLQLMNFFKVYCDQRFLAWSFFTAQKYRNRSKTMVPLFLMRIGFNIVSLVLYMAVFTGLDHKWNESEDNTKEKA